MTAPERPVKQVIIIRRDLGMRRGKEVAQGAHAAMAWLTERLEKAPAAVACDEVVLEGRFTLAECAWVNGGFTKIVCQVASEEELRALHFIATVEGVQANLIQDAGRTEFGGVPTITALAVGPDWADAVDRVTGKLKLY